MSTLISVPLAQPSLLLTGSTSLAQGTCASDFIAKEEGTGSNRGVDGIAVSADAPSRGEA